MLAGNDSLCGRYHGRPSYHPLVAAEAETGTR